MKKFLIIVISLLYIYACELENSESDSDLTVQTVLDSQTLRAPEQVVHQTYEWKKYENNHYRFSIEYPEEWRVIESTRNPEIPVINVYSKEFDNGFKLPLMIHEEPKISHISFFPKGLGVDGPRGAFINLKEAETNLPIPFQLDSAVSKAYQLNDGSIWGYYLKPERVPKKNWTDDGFIFIQLQVVNYQVKCFDASGKEKPVNRCHTLGGDDRMIRYGKLDQGDQQLINHMLSTLHFVDSSKPRQPLSQLIRIENISENDTINSPVVIKGRARGPWFFEGQFPVELKDSNHKTITKNIAKAKSKWMTSEWVDFEASLDFNMSQNSKKGYIVLRRSNASGKAELDRSYTLPVILDGQ